MRMRWGKYSRLVICVSVLIFSGVVTGCTFLAETSDGLLNSVTLEGPYRDKVKPANADFHQKLFVADLHADSLSWNRELWESTPSDRGHIDLPRLLEGNIALQAFTVFTKIPLPLFRLFSQPRFSWYFSDSAPDVASLLALVQFRSDDYRHSLLIRALEQAKELHDLEERDSDRFAVIETSNDLEKYIDRRKANPRMSAGFLGLEGAHALEGNLDKVDVLFEAGYRMMALTHFFDNEFGGSSTGGSSQGLVPGAQGLTPKGKGLIQKMKDKGVILDLSHASYQTLEDILMMSDLPPLVVSHTGIRGTCKRDFRNLSDPHIDLIGKKGGLIGVGLWKGAVVCKEDEKDLKEEEYVEKTVEAILHVKNRLKGVDRIAIGSDFDGAVTTHFDARGMPLLTQALKKEFSEVEVCKIMGGNLVTFLLNHLPKGTSGPSSVPSNSASLSVCPP